MSFNVGTGEANVTKKTQGYLEAAVSVCHLLRLLRPNSLHTVLEVTHYSLSQHTCPTTASQMHFVS